MSNESIICEKCYPEAVVIKRLSDYLELVEYPSNHYMLVVQNGHLPKDVIVDFPINPRPDEDNDQWLTDADALENLLMMSPGDGYFLWDECLNLGFLKDDGPRVLHYWLFDKMGKFINNYKGIQNEQISNETNH